ncbi:MAG TPA: phosphate signaling complex protein PhoU [Longimicrobiales bacterium]|nr:phosphate signaling complex protein PhoU [Longimicrobiales bacterium]
MKRHRHFEDELEKLKQSLVAMAGLAEAQVARAVQSLLERDVAKAEAVIAGDRDIDDLEIAVDNQAVQLLALQQPMARDLRFITMAMKIGNDLERVGDHAVNIAENVGYIAGAPPLPKLPELEEMVGLATEMLNDALDAFVRADSSLAWEIGRRDDRVDELHENVFRILLTHMMEDPRKIGAGIDMILVSRNLERIADLATNVAEDVIFMVEGRTIKHHTYKAGE